MVHHCKQNKRKKRVTQKLKLRNFDEHNAIDLWPIQLTEVRKNKFQDIFIRDKAFNDDPDVYAPAHPA